MGRPTVAKIDLSAIMHNVRTVRKLTGGRKICAAVKADAYGHGAPAAAKAMDAAGVDMFGVAMTEEGIQLREAGIQKPVILLTRVPEIDSDELINHELTACITDESFAEFLSEKALRHGQPTPVHVNVDTGMGRVGIPHQEAAAAVLRISELPGLKLTGLFTHFACSGDRSLSREQLALFRGVLRSLVEQGYELPTVHVANSTATLLMPEAHMDCVRPGLILYGLMPTGVPTPELDLRPALSLHTRVSFLKSVPPGTKLGYGHTFTTWRHSKIATLPIGYHDGYLRQYSNCGQVLVGGKRAPVVGRVCMDQTLADVTEVDGVKAQDEVVVYGEQNGTRVSIQEMASLLGRIPYELTCSVGGRVRRQYWYEGSMLTETPMRSLVPPESLREIFPQKASDDRSDKEAA